MKEPSSPIPQRNTPNLRCRQSVDKSRRWPEDRKRASWCARRRRQNRNRARALASRPDGHRHSWCTASPLPVTQTGDPGAAGLLPQDISVGQAPLAARFFDDLSEPVRDRTEKPVPCVNDLVRGVLSTLRGWIASKRRTASRRRVRLREGRFGAPRDEGQNQEGGPHHSLHRVLHSRESCSTVTTKLCGFIFAPARTQGAIISIMILMPANALSISLCTRSTSDLRNVCSCRSSGESISSPSIEFEVRRKTEDKILSASTSIWVTGPRFLADRGSGDGASRRNAGFPPAFVASTQEYL